MALAEDDDEVAGNDLRLAVDENTFSCANDTADIRFVRQPHVFDLMAGDGTAFFGVELYDLRVGARQVMYTAYGGVQQHLVDI